MREVGNVLERATLLARGGPLSKEHFAGLRTASSTVVPRSGEEGDLASVERKHVMGMLERYGADVAKAAKALGISRASLYRRLKEYKDKD